MSAPTTRRVELDEVGLDVAEAGQGGRPLLLVHGFTGAKEDFTEWLVPLGERGWHAVAPDLRGHGGSDSPAGTGAYSIRIFAHDLVALVDALDWGHVVLLGHSLGGMIAQEVALSPAGTRLDGLVLMDTGHGPVDGIDPGLIELGIQLVRQGGMVALAATLAGLGDESPLTTPAELRARARWPGYAEDMGRKLAASSPDMWLAMVDELGARADTLPGLAGLTVPTLVLVGAEDTPFVAPSRRMADAIPGARFEVLPGAGHSPQFEATEAWWSALISFLDGLAGGSERL